MAKKNAGSESKPTRTPGRRRTANTAQAAPASAPDSQPVTPPSPVRSDNGPLNPKPEEYAAIPAAVSAAGHGVRAAHRPDVGEFSPSPEEIQRRAYQLYLKRGRKHGHDLDDWYQAERELRHGGK